MKTNKHINLIFRPIHNGYDEVENVWNEFKNLTKRDGITLQKAFIDMLKEYNERNK